MTANALPAQAPKALRKLAKGTQSFVALSVVILAAGCIAQSDGQSSDEVDTIPPAAEWTEVPPASEWERLYRDWVSNGVPEDIDWMELYEIQLQSTAESYRQLVDGDLPQDVEFVRFVEAGDKPMVTVECLEAQGFAARIGADGGVFPDEVPPDQSSALMEATYRCDVQFPVHPRYYLPPTVSQVRTYYDYYRDELVPCLRAEGQDVPDPPTWETFAGNYHSSSNWHPYDFVDTRSPQHQEDLNRTCPAQPPWERVFGTGD